MPEKPAEPALEDTGARTAIFKARFGPHWRFWSWFSQQWTPTSIVALASAVVAAAAIFINLRSHVTILETRVVPVLEERNSELKDRADIDDLQGRISRIEHNWDDAQKEAATPPVVIRRRGTK